MKRALSKLWRGLLLTLIMLIFGALVYLSIILTDSPERRMTPQTTPQSTYNSTIIIYDQGDVLS